MLEINFESVLDEYDALSQNRILKTWVARTVGNAMSEWLQMVKAQVPESQRADYLMGRDVEVISDHRVDLVLIGKYPNFIEEGTESPVDMRTWLTDSPSAKGRRKWSQLPLNKWRQRQGQTVEEKPGWYNIVPFSSKKEPTPSIIEHDLRKAGVDSGRAKDVAKIIRREIRSQLLANERREVKNFDPNSGQGRKASIQYKRNVHWGARLNMGGKSLKAELGDDYKLARSRYQGMVRTIKVYEKMNEDAFTTFRIISSLHGRGQSWMYPRKPGPKLMEQLAKYVDDHGFEWLDEVLALL